MRYGLGLSGVPVDDVSMVETLQHIENMIEQGGTHQIATANVDYLVHAVKDIEYRRNLCMCDLVVADGMPIVWASRLFGIPLRERVAGADLVPQLVRLSALKGYSLFLLGATPQVAEAAEQRMKLLGPGVRIAGRLSPPVRPLDQFDNAAILEEIERAKPDILLVAFGSPKQEKWIGRNRDKLNVPVCIGIGGTLDFIAGTVRRAPKWMQHSGLEWLFRLSVDPQRLAPRYCADALWLARYIFTQVVVQRAFRYRQQNLKIDLDSIGSINILAVSGAMTGAGLRTLETAASSALVSGRPIVLDLTATSHLGADGLWTLAGLLRTANQRGCEVWLAGASRSLERQFRAAHFQDLFKSVPALRDAIRGISRNRLQINLELGDKWAICRLSGDLPSSARPVLEEILSCVRQANDHLELDASGMTDFDPDHLISPVRQSEKTAFGETPRTRTTGTA